jgi:hypothetical protein
MPYISYHEGTASVVDPGTATFVASKTYSYFSSTPSPSTSLTDLKDADGNDATLLEDDLIIVTMSRTSTSNLGASATSPSSSGYTNVCDLYGNDNFDCNFGVNYKFMGATPDTSVSFPGTGGGGMAVTIFALRGVDTANPLDVTPTTAAGSNSASANPPAITPLTPGCIISVHVGNTNLELLTNPGDLSSVTNHFQVVSVNATDESQAGTGLKEDWASGSFDPAIWTTSESFNDSWCAATIAWRPATA